MNGYRNLPYSDDEVLRAIVRCASLISGVILLGTLGFHWVEPEWSLWKSMFFTLITVTTVGYGDFNLSVHGQQFAAVLLLCGIGVVTYSLTTLVHLAVDHDYQRRRKMKRQIDKCQDHIVICGYGRMGRTTCQHLALAGLPCVVIESNDDRYQRAIDDHRLVVHGVASRDDVLLKAGIARARGIVCAVDSDAENMYIVVSARDLNQNCLIISRADSEDAVHKLQRAGAGLVISPLQMAGQSIAQALIGRPMAVAAARQQDASRDPAKKVQPPVSDRQQVPPSSPGDPLEDSLAAMAEALLLDLHTRGPSSSRSAMAADSTAGRAEGQDELITPNGLTTAEVL